jgi:ABC-type transport system substrate-binding protein
MKDFWQHPEGGVEILDSHTLTINTGVPWVDIRAFEFLRHVGGTSANVVSKRQSDEMGADAASRDIAMTGPWEIDDHRTGEFWRMKAVPDHWRQTPYFDELVIWEIPEESARLAGFQTGNLDTFAMSFDNIPLVEDVPGARIQRGGIIGQAGLNLYGQMYVGVGTPDQHAAFKPDRAWVSANPDVNSPEWDRARMVRQALSLAIDRETIVDTLLGGYGGVLAVRDWAGFESRMPETWQWEFNPDRAEQLLAEAGYPDGFTIDLATAIRGAPSEVEACEAIATMWGNVGVDVKLQRIPYETLRPQLVARTWGGATCHTVSERLEPVLGLSNYVDKTVFNYGTFHPWMEDRIPSVFDELDSAKRFQGVLEVYDWITMQQALGFGLYYVQGAIPVGPRIEEWEYTSYSDIRLPNGYENIRPRR